MSVILTEDWVLASRFDAGSMPQGGPKTMILGRVTDEEIEGLLNHLDFYGVTRLTIRYASFDPKYYLALRACLSHLRIHVITNGGEDFSALDTGVLIEDIDHCDDYDCCFCLEPKNDAVGVCGHRFHMACMETYTKTRGFAPTPCPLCNHILTPPASPHFAGNVSVVWERPCKFGFAPNLDSVAQDLVIMGGTTADVKQLAFARGCAPRRLFIHAHLRMTVERYRHMPTEELHIYFQPQRERRQDGEMLSREGIKWRFHPQFGIKVFPHGANEHETQKARIWNMLVGKMDADDIYESLTNGI